MALAPTFVALTLLLFSLPALAAHPLSVDDAGTLDPATWELELSSAVTDPGSGAAHAAGIAARMGILPSFDAGIALSWASSTPWGPGSELVWDLKFAPGSARGWRPRPFLRSDFALTRGENQAEASLAAFCGGLTWELPEVLVSVEACCGEPMSSSFGDGSLWGAAAGLLVQVKPRFWLAGEWRRVSLEDPTGDAARAGLLADFQGGSLSLGFEFGIREARWSSATAHLGWTVAFAP